MSSRFIHWSQPYPNAVQTFTVHSQPEASVPCGGSDPGNYHEAPPHGSAPPSQIPRAAVFWLFIACGRTMYPSRRRRVRRGARAGTHPFVEWRLWPLGYWVTWHVYHRLSALPPLLPPSTSRLLAQPVTPSSSAAIPLMSLVDRFPASLRQHGHAGLFFTSRLRTSGYCDRASTSAAISPDLQRRWSVTTSSSLRLTACNPSGSAEQRMTEPTWDHGFGFAHG